MRRHIVILAALVAVAGGMSAQTNCDEECFMACAVSSQEVCDRCLDECNRPEWRRVAPLTPSRQPGVNYLLHRTVGLTALNYENPNFSGWLETTREMDSLGFTTAGLWLDIPPYCPGHWVEPYPSHEWVQDVFGCEAEVLIQRGPMTQIFIKPSILSWLVAEDGCYIIDTAPLGFLVYRLYEMAWWRDLTVVFMPWEQDWYPEGCPKSLETDRLEWLIKYESRRQQQVETSRAAMLQKYPHARLNVLHAMVVNQFPGYNIDDDHPTVSEAIGRMVENPDLYEPDLVGISYWKRGLDPIPALDWVQSVSHYPRSRIFIAEFGARQDEQPDRYLDYIPAFWEWGIRTVLVWVYEDTWEKKYSVGLDGMIAIQELNERAITWGNEK